MSLGLNISLVAELHSPTWQDLQVAKTTAIGLLDLREPLFGRGNSAYIV